MPERNPVGIQSYKNSEVTTISQYRVVCLGTADETMKLPTAAKAGGILGVTQSAVAAAETGAVTMSGIEYVTAFAAFSKGDILVIGDTAGRVAAKAAGATDQGEGIVGMALRAAGAQGDLIPCQLQNSTEYAT